MPNQFLDLLQFVLENRGDKVFKGYDEEQIVQKLAKHLADDTCWITLDNNNKITGMIIATPNWIDRLLFIDENLAMNSANLKAFARRARNVYPNFTLEFYKNGTYHLDTKNTLYDELCS